MVMVPTRIHYIHYRGRITPFFLKKQTKAVNMAATELSQCHVLPPFSFIRHTRISRFKHLYL